MLGDKTIDCLETEELFWQYNETINSISIIVKHLWGNMMSRWTDFLTSDGEKTWRNREAEFQHDFRTKEALLAIWEEGWACLFDTIKRLSAEDLNKIVYIRNQGHTVVEAINRQVAHYAYHIGQLVFIGKMTRGKRWISLSIPKGNSEAYNADKFSKPRKKGHFTDEYLKGDSTS